MSPKRAKPARKLRGVQKWILQELGDVGASTTLSTSKIAKRIARSSGKEYHMNSLYLALRTLTRRGAIESMRKGTEKTYRLPDRERASISGSVPDATTSAPPVSSEVMATSPHLTWPERVAHEAMLPHKLALGEILVLSVNHDHILAATNQHGRLVFERHSLSI